MLFQGLIQRNVICFFFVSHHFVCFLYAMLVIVLSYSEMKNIKFFTTNLTTERGERERERDKKSMLPANSLTYLFRFPICSLVWRGSIRLVDELSINVCTSLCSEELSQGKFFSKFHFNKIFSGFCLNYTIHDNRRT